MKTLLLSVWDKTGLTDFLTRLKEFDEMRLIATRSTSKYLEQHGFQCIAVEELTKFPEILDGRVKTLHPKVFAGILARPSKEDRDCLSEHGIEEIDYVIANLYPFKEKLADNLSEPEMIEYIDIGGVSLLRAAAKNFSRVTVACLPAQYSEIVAAVAEGNGSTSLPVRRKLAYQAFEQTAEYDRQIASYFQRQIGDEKTDSPLPQRVHIQLNKEEEMRYGENPHQSAAWYSAPATGGIDWPPFEQLQGKQLSYNNIIDSHCLIKILRDLSTPAVCIIKHNNPCGVATGKSIDDAFDKAYSTDPMAAFGGIYGFTAPVSETLALKINDGFVEIVIAPDFEAGALKELSKKKNLRVLKTKPGLLKTDQTGQWQYRHVGDFGWLVQKDNEGPVKPDKFQEVVGKLSKEDKDDVAFAWAVTKHLTSNAIFIAKGGKSLGFGIGQTSRIASMKLALAQAGPEAKAAILASDAFFPATDNIDAAAAAGIKVIIQPGGSVKDKDVIAACEKAGITMLFTGQRCFRH